MWYLRQIKNYKVKDTVIVHSVEEMRRRIKKYNSEDVYVIGGESIYRQPSSVLYKKAYVTRIDHVYDADTYFPDLDADPEWEMTKISDEQTYFDLEYVFVIYERR
ncbi:MAG: dihydrofolate reductase [Coprococcus sp.]